MSSKKKIEIIENNIRLKNNNNEIEIDSLLAGIPILAYVDWGDRKILEEKFEPKDEKEREYFIKQVKDILDMLLIDYRDFITLVYGELEAYISKCIDNKNMYNEFKERFNKEHQNRGEIYKMAQYLVEKREIQLTSEEIEIIKFIDNEIRYKRNILVHEELSFYKEIDAEEILNSGQITSILKTIELEHKNNKNKVLFIIKQFINTIDNKFI
ncbi:hypothetical protein ACV3O0_06355 [Clostridium perfringens]